ncbi:MAG: hypothetical protein WCY93_08675 [Anaerolineaceae bacterium]
MMSNRTDELVFMFNLTYDGLEFEFIYDAGPGFEPDTLTVVPPPGYYVLPENSLTVDEGDLVIFEVHQHLLG